MLALCSRSAANGSVGRTQFLPTVCPLVPLCICPTTRVQWRLTATSPPVAFLSALIIGCSLHYHKIVQNEWYGYPQEWFPSVSATIGDRYPERSTFMIAIAITSGMSGLRQTSMKLRLSRLSLTTQARALLSLASGTCLPRSPAARFPRPSPSRALSVP